MSGSGLGWRRCFRKGFGKGILIFLGWAALARTAGALMVVEDFEFYPEGPLGKNAGGSGFSGAWTLNVDNGTLSNGVDLVYPATGYEVAGLTPGALNCGSLKASLLCNREFAAPFYGTSAGRAVWFSTLVRFTSPGRVGWNFNSRTTSRNDSDAGFLCVGTDLRKLVNGVLTSTGVTLAANVTHLILGCVGLKDTGSSTVRLWLDPADCTSAGTLGAEQVSFDAVFDNGCITEVGLDIYAGETFLDALRISDGNGDAEQAFRDVTKDTPKALFGPVQFGNLPEVTHHFALLNATTNDWLAEEDNNYGAGGFLRAVNTNGHHTFVIDHDGSVAGGLDLFGDCTIDYDMRAVGVSERLVGVFFLGSLPTSRNDKHWMLNTNIGSDTNYIRAFYGRTMGDIGGGSVQEAVTNALNCSDWCHVRLDVRRVNLFTQVEVRNRIWNNTSDFRGPPVVDATILYDADHSRRMDGEIGFSIYRSGSGTTADIDNLAVFRYGGAPDWYVPRGTVIKVR